MNDYQIYLKRLEDDIRLRGYSERTLRSYVSSVRYLLEYTARSVTDLTEEDVRGYQMYLLDEKKLSRNTVNLYIAGIRFFFAVTLNRNMNYLQMPRVKKSKKLPVLLSREEVISLLSHTKNLKHSAILKLAYGSGLRAGEITRLKPEHIDAKVMRLLVVDGKGAKDRYTILSYDCLETLRKYWKTYRRPNRGDWIFPGSNCTRPMTYASVRNAFDLTKERAGITKDVSIHVLRHLFATHLLEDGVNLLNIQSLLGHSSIQSTTIYLHLANTTADIVSPADSILASHGLPAIGI
jgi:site-specific recombinase XerD